MTAAAWNQLAERSRALMHRISLLLGVLTHPALTDDDLTSRRLVAEETQDATRALVETMAAMPELAAHLRTIQRLETALAAWRRCLEERGPLTRRYQTALLQQAAQALTSCLHVETLATSESSRVEATRQEASRALEARIAVARDEGHTPH